MNTINKSIKEALFRAYNTRNRNNKNQKRFDVIFGTIFCLCIIMTIAAFGLMGANVKAGVIMLLIILLCFGAAVTYALLRKRRIMKDPVSCNLLLCDALPGIFWYPHLFSR